MNGRAMGLRPVAPGLPESLVNPHHGRAKQLFEKIVLTALG
jgi:hypothetical protein